MGAVESFSWVGVWEKISWREGGVLYLPFGTMGLWQCWVRVVSHAASRVRHSYFGLCLPIKIANAEAGCAEAVAVLSSGLRAVLWMWLCCPEALLTQL